MSKAVGLTKEELLPNVLNDIVLSENLYKEDRVLEAYQLLNHIENFVKNLDVRSQSVFQATISASDLITKIRTCGDRISSLLILMNEEENWNVWNSAIGMNQDITVSTHKNEEKGQYYFKVEGMVHCDILYAVAALLENDLYHFWLPLCTKADCLVKVSQHRRIMRSKFDFTLLKKEALYNSYADILHDGSVLISVQSLTPAEEHELLGPAHFTPIPSPSTISTSNFGPSGHASLSRLDINGGILLRSADSASALAAAARKRKKDNLTSTVDPTSNLSPYEQLCNRIASNASSAGGCAVADGGVGFPSNRAEYHGSRKHNVVKKKSNKESTSNGPVSLSFEDDGKDEDNEGEEEDFGFDGPPTQVVAVFVVDPHLDYVPDWIFTMAVRSAISTLIPMLEFQAKQFDEQEGVHSHILVDNSSFYDDIETRLNEYRKNNS